MSENIENQTEKTPEQIRDEKIKTFEAKAKQLSEKFGTEVRFQTVTKGDKILVGYFRKPHVMVAARAMDLLSRDDHFNAGYQMWPACFIKEESSPEIESDSSIQLGLLPFVGTLIEITIPDVKKS